jgi:hypothetical protein
MAASLLVTAAAVLGLLIGARGPDAPDAPPTAVLQPNSPNQATRATRPASQTATDPLDAHQRMLEQMRVTVTPNMIEVMNADPLAHSPKELTELERHAADIDRMLARNQ